MKMGFTVDLVDPDESFDVDTDGRDIRRWEATESASYIRSTTTVTQLAQLAYLAAVRLEQFAGTWEEFDERCVSVKSRRLDPTLGEAPTTPTDHTASSYADSPSDSASSPHTSSPRATP